MGRNNIYYERIGSQVCYEELFLTVVDLWYDKHIKQAVIFSPKLEICLMSNYTISPPKIFAKLLQLFVLLLPGTLVNDVRVGGGGENIKHV